MRLYCSETFSCYKRNNCLSKVIIYHLTELPSSLESKCFRAHMDMKYLTEFQFQILKARRRKNESSL